MSSRFDLGLPQLTAEQPPQFTSLITCEEWLAGVPITNATQAQAQLLRQINLLNHFKLAAEERLKILETLRAPVSFVHDECQKRYVARPRPLAPPEQAALDSNLALWQALETGYLHCLQDCLDATFCSTGVLTRAAFAATRALTALLSAYLDHCAAAILPPPSFWQRVHKTYLATEKIQATLLPVEDKLRHNPAVTAAATYVEILLLDAALPFELDAREIAQVSYWAHRWSAKVAILPALPEDLRTPPLCVDTGSDQPAGFHPAAGENARWLDLGHLRKTIKQRLVKLAEGESPKDLKLGRDCVQPACEQLLTQVYQDWCKGGRNNAGKPPQHAAFQIATGIEAIHYFIGGRVFHAPEQQVYAKREHDRIATFGSITRHSEAGKPQPGFTLEHWQALEETLDMLRLRRSLGPTGHSQIAGGRLACHQLVAVRPGEQGNFQLGTIRWVTVSDARALLVAGLRLLPGMPTASLLFNPGLGSIKGQYAPGFCLPAIAALHLPASVIMPDGWYRAGQILEIRTDAIIKVRMTQLIERGTDFDRCAFETI